MARSGRLAILLLASCVALGGCASSNEEVEPAEGSHAAEQLAAAGPLRGLFGQLEAEDDQTEQSEHELQAPESVEEQQETKEELQQEEAQHRESEERAIEEEAHVGANGGSSS